MAIALITGSLSAPGAASAAEIFFASTPTNQLISFTSQAPGKVLSRETIEGLAAGEAIVGMDRRPATTQLYLLTSAGRILVVDRSSGDTRVITPTALALTGTTFGFDINPATDRIRIVSDADLNIRVHPDTGVIEATDGALTYRGGDPGTGANPAVGAVAHTSSTFGSMPATTALFGIDSLRDSLTSHNPPNEGTLATEGALGVDAVEPVHFDIAGNGTRYAAFGTAGSAPMRLWKISATGSATPATEHAALSESTITAMTTVGETRNDTSAPFVAVGNYTTFRGIWLDRGLRFTTTCTTECTTVVTLRIGTTVAGTITEQIPGPGTRAPLIKLTPAGRALASQPGRKGASITFENTDLAGNTRTQVASFASLPGFITS